MTTTSKLSILALALLAALLGGCGGGVAEKNALQSDINLVLHARVPGMTDCYKAALERDKKIQGAMMLTFFVPEGSVDVSEVTLVSSQITDQGLKQCVSEKAQGMKLSKPAFRPARVSYPLQFTPL
jgi:hypothetical protein